jgi:hypothetical protein
MRPKFLFILTAYFCSCHSDLEKVTVFDAHNFVIVDTTSEAKEFLPIDIHSSDYPIYYIGSQLDTIKIGKRYWRGRTEWTDDFKTPLCRTYSIKTLEILVDTSMKTNSPVEYFSTSQKVSDDSTINYKSFLFSIKNISDSTIFMGRTFSVFFICREIKNKNGEWIKIDKKLSDVGICGTGEPIITLKPSEILISKMKRYKGSFVADFRLVYGYGNNVVYSNIFKDSIDEKIFQNQIVTKTCEQ